MAEILPIWRKTLSSQSINQLMHLISSRVCIPPISQWNKKLKKYHFSKSLQKTIKISDRTAKLNFIWENKKIKEFRILKMNAHRMCISIILQCRYLRIYIVHAQGVDKNIFRRVMKFHTFLYCKDSIFILQY